MFGHQSHINDHVKAIHEKFKPYKCESCDKRFSKKVSLEDHVNIIHMNGKILQKSS